MSVVIVTWVLVLLSVFSLNYTTDALSESRSVAYELERHQLRALARSGVELTMVTLAETPLIDCAALVSCAMVAVVDYANVLSFALLPEQQAL